MDYFQPFREKRNQIIKNSNFVFEILNFGAEKAKKVASGVIERVKSCSGLKYSN